MIQLTIPPLLEYQREILREYKKPDTSTIVVVGSRRSGKSHMAKILIILEAVAASKRIAIIGPTRDQVTNIYWASLERKALELEKHGCKVTINKSSREITIDKAFIKCYSSSAIDTIRGTKFDLAILDECCFFNCSLKTAVEKDVGPTLMDSNGIMMLLSSPTIKGYFYELYMRGQTGVPGYKSFSIQTHNNPYVSQEFLAKKRSELSESAYANEYLGEFLESGNLFKLSPECYTNTIYTNQRTTTFSIDPARKRDFTVCIVRQDDTIIDMLRIQNETYLFQAEEIITLAKKYNPETIYIESNAGYGLIDLLGGLPVKPIVMTRDYKHEIITKLANDLEKGNIKFATNLLGEKLDIIKAELDLFDFKVSRDGKMTYGTTHQTTEDDVELNDDSVVALAISNWEAAPMRWESFGGSF